MAAIAVAGWSLVVALIVLLFMGADDPREDEVVDDAPDGTAGDLLDGQPTDVLVNDEQVRQLERTWLL